MSEPEAPGDRTGAVALASKRERVSTRYRVALSRDEILERLAEHPEVKVFKGKLPDLGDVVDQTGFVARRTEDGFVVYADARPAAQGSYGTASGLAPQPTLSVVVTGRRNGSDLECSFAAVRSPRSSLRIVGFLGMLAAGLFWVLVGESGIVVQRAILYGVFALLGSALVAYDLGQRRALARQRTRLFSLMEQLWGPQALPEGDGPYRVSSGEGR